jgi:hypothetical protein
MRCLLIALVLVVAATARRAQAEPPNTHEIIYSRPSGFWTSNRPAIGGAYRYRLLGIGVVIAGITGYVVVRALRRASEERGQRGDNAERRRRG